MDILNPFHQYALALAVVGVLFPLMMLVAAWMGLRKR